MASSVGTVGVALYYRPRIWQTYLMSSERVEILLIENYTNSNLKYYNYGIHHANKVLIVTNSDNS